jgi:hypothetical protein
VLFFALKIEDLRCGSSGRALQYARPWVQSLALQKKKKKIRKLGVMGHTYNPSTQKAEARGF